MMLRQASSVVASGFSQKTGLPAAIAARTYASWVGPHEVHDDGVDLVGSAIRSSPVACTVALGQPVGDLAAPRRRWRR